MKYSPIIHTADGSSVHITRRGILFDLETRNALGETVSTVVMDEDDAGQLMEDIDDLEVYGGYSTGYDVGYEAGEKDAA